MINKKFLISLLALTFNISGCFTFGYSTGFGPQGSLFSYTTQGVGTNGKLAGPLTGKACVHSILTLTALGDGSAEQAAKNAGITNIYTVDKTTLGIYVFYSNLCTKVTGDNTPIKLATNIIQENVTNFRDTVTLKDGQVLQNVKATIKEDSIVVDSSEGNTVVYKKSEVKGIKKNSK